MFSAKNIFMVVVSAMENIKMPYGYPVKELDLGYANKTKQDLSNLIFKIIKSFIVKFSVE